MNARSAAAVLVISLCAAWGCGRNGRPAREAQDDSAVPVYPGASAAASERFARHLLPQDRARLVRARLYETKDPVEKVVAFYEESLKGKTQVLRTKTGGLPSAVIRAEIGGRYYLLTITSNEDRERTEIAVGEIARAGER